MELFNQKKDVPVAEVIQLREQGLTDAIINDELTNEGFSNEQILQALAQANSNGQQTMQQQQQQPSQMMPAMQSSAPQQEDMGNIYERIEEITESLIDDKWDDLIVEVKKIIDWKNKVDEKQIKMSTEIDKLKEDFKILHQGVLGKLEDYDTKMQDVGTELKAVGKVFKDVIPQFVSNVKDLGRITNSMKDKR